MKRTMSIIAAALMMVGTSASMASAANDYGSQPGYSIATGNTSCAGAGAFGAFGSGNNFAGGADGTQTGINNSTLCGDPHNN